MTLSKGDSLVNGISSLNNDDMDDGVNSDCGRFSIDKYVLDDSACRKSFSSLIRLRMAVFSIKN